jgi:hypothetical protein
MTDKAVYFKISDYEAAFTTGSRSANYHCYCLIYDSNMQLINGHPLYDVFYGKWTRCEKVISKWRKAVNKAKLQRLPIPNPFGKPAGAAKQQKEW